MFKKANKSELKTWMIGDIILFIICTIASISMLGTYVNDKKISYLIFGIISFCILIIISIMAYMLIRNESSRVYFNIKEIENFNWKSNNVLFNYIDGKVTLEVNGDKMYNEKEATIDTQTGEILKDKLYIRSVTNNNLVIWYEKEEYRLQKEIIAR